MMFRYLKILSIAVLFSFALGTAAGKAAPFVEYLKNYEDKYHNYDEGPGAQKRGESRKVSRRSYFYEEPTSLALAHLFWAVELYDLADDNAVDEFIYNNECSIFKRFRGNEFEWRDIRDASREFLRKNKYEFPTRFEFMMPLKLGDYDEKRQAFVVQSSYKIDALRRFEVFATDLHTKSCLKRKTFYPRGIVLEFSRPFSLDYIPYDITLAKQYIQEKLRVAQKNKNKDKITKAYMNSLRDAYLVLKVKIFTHGKSLGKNREDIYSVQMMGVLEGYEIYKDPQKESLMHSEYYVTKSERSNLVSQLQDQFETLRKKSEQGGILH